jgi:hypothetical protein
MRYFDIYLLKEAIAELYVGKEDLLYGLFMEAVRERNPRRKVILKRQVHFISEPIAPSLFQRLFSHQSASRAMENQFTITLKDGSQATLIFDHYISLEASGNLGAEAAVFEGLRKYNPYFFAVDYQNDCGAWLSPQKKHLLNHRQFVL